MKPQYKISTACLVVFEEKLLMVKEEQSGKVSWDIPAGGLELGETIEEGVIREVYEETGLRIATASLKAVYEFIEKEKTTINFLFEYRLPIGNESQIHALDSDIQDIQWFSKDDLNVLLTTGEFEHNLAKERLESFLSENKKKLELLTIYS